MPWFPLFLITTIHYRFSSALSLLTQFTMARPGVRALSIDRTDNFNFLFQTVHRMHRYSLIPMSAHAQCLATAMGFAMQKVWSIFPTRFGRTNQKFVFANDSNTNCESAASCNHQFVVVKSNFAAFFLCFPFAFVTRSGCSLRIERNVRFVYGTHKSR